MPVQLTTPLSGGDLGADMTHAKVTALTHNSEAHYIMVHLKFGTMADGKFAEGDVQPANKCQYKIGPDHAGIGEEGDDDYLAPKTEYMDLVGGHTPNVGELTYAAVKRGIYEFLIDNGIVSGTIV